MAMKARKKIFSVGALCLATMLAAGPAAAKQVTVDAETLTQLQQLVKAQQQQLDALQQQVNQFQQTAIQAKNQAEEAKVVAEEAKSGSGGGKTVTSGSERVKLAISGQVNRAVSVVDDGDETDFYFVDNDASNTRIRFIGTAGINEDLTLGGRMELAFAPNISSKVNQNEQETSDFIDERVAEISLNSKRFGTITLGKGSTASDGTAEVDLSGTSVVQYSSVSSIAGGMLFRESASDELSALTVGKAFNNFDGLSRKNRLRYDTPTFYGFGLAASAISDSRWDTGLTWSGSGYGFKLGAAAGLAYVNEASADYQYDGSVSLLHEESGLNFTLAGGTKDADSGDDPYSIYGKLGWKTQFCPLGTTAFGIDYGYGENLSGDGDESDSIGLAVVQNIADYGTEIYFQFRQYSLDRDTGSDVDDINVGTVGARVKF